MENNVDEIGIYKRTTGAFVRFNNNAPTTLRQIVSAKHTVQYMASDTITIEVDSVAKITDIEVGDYLKHGGGTYRLNNQPSLRKTGERLLHYTFILESVKYELADIFFLQITENGTPVSEIERDDYTGTMLEILKMIVANANRVHPSQWQLPLDGNGQWAGTATLPSDAKTLTFDGQKCLYVLQNICEQWSEGRAKYEFIIEENATTGVRTIDIVEYDRATDYIDNAGQPFQYGAGNGLYEIERTASNSDSVVTRLFVFGSKDNLPARYFATRLGLAKARGNTTVGNKALSYIETYIQGGQTITPQNTYGLREGVANFDDIKPHATFHVRSVGTIAAGSDFYIYIKQGTGEPAMFDLNAQWKHYNSDNGADYREYLLLRNLANNANILQSYETNVADTYKYIATGETPAVTFNSGDLTGLTFNLKATNTGVDYNHGLLRVKLLPKDEENAFDPATGTTTQHYYTPNATIQPKAGDAFVFTGINLPWSYIAAAEQQLKTEGEQRFEEVSQPKAAYKIKLANDFVRETYGIHALDILTCGKYLRITDSEIGLADKKIRITQYSRDLMKGYEYDVTISDFAPRPRTNLLQASTTTPATAATGNEANANAGTNTIGGGLALDMEFVATTTTLNFYAIDSGSAIGLLSDPTKAMRWLIDNDTISLPEDADYDIYISATKSGAGTASVYVRDARLRKQAQAGKLTEQNKSYLTLAGRVSRITYDATTTTPYRIVEMYIGRARNQARDFIGTEIKDADGNLTIKLGSGETEMKLGDATQGLSFSRNSLILKKAKAQSENDESTIACYRGDFVAGATYNEGDEVRVQVDDNNVATFRCLQDATSQQEPPTPTDPRWAALSATTIGGGGGVSDYDDLDNRPQWDDSTGTPQGGSGTFTGTTYFKTVNGESIIGQGNIETGSSVSIDIVGSELKITDTGSVVAINNNTLIFTT